MRIRIILIAANLILVLMAATVLWAQSYEAIFGSWKLNIAKSKYNPGPAPKSNSKKYEPWEGGFKATQDTVTATGEVRHVEVAGKFDGKDYPGKGSPEADTYAIRKIDDHTYEVVQKKDGKVTITARNVVAADGKTRTVTQTGKNAKGVAVNNTLLWEKQ